MHEPHIGAALYAARLAGTQGRTRGA